MSASNNHVSEGDVIPVVKQEEHIETDPLQRSKLIRGYDRGAVILVGLSLGLAIVITFGLIISIYFGPPQIPYSGAVVTDHEACTDIAIQLLKKGATASEAAIGANFCLTVARAEIASLGGDGFAVVHDHKDNRALSLEYRSCSSSGMKAATPVSSQSGDKVGVPGFLAGMLELHGRGPNEDSLMELYQTLEWADVIAPAINLARDGFKMSPNTVKLLKRNSNVWCDQSNPMSKFYCKNGAILPPGSLIKRPDLVKALSIVRDEGVKSFYGVDAKLAQEVAAEVAGKGDPQTIVKLSDFAAYKAMPEKSPMRSDFANFTVIFPNVPSAGVTVAETLAIYERLGKEANDSLVSATENLTPEQFHRFVEAFKFGQADHTMLGEGTSVSAEQLLTNESISARADKFNPDKVVGPNPADYCIEAGCSDLVTLPSPLRNEISVSVSVIDRNEVMVSTTTSLGSIFGANLFSGPYGFALNDHLSSFSSSGNNAPGPSKRPVSNQAPLVVQIPRSCKLRGCMAGSPDAWSLQTSTQTLLNLISLQKNAENSGAMPRLLPDLASSKVFYEADFPEDMVTKLRERDHKLAKLEDVEAKVTDNKYCSFALAQKIDNELGAFADPRVNASSRIFN